MTYPLLQYALQLAAQGRDQAPPNPSVGCVICDADGNMIGKGHTQTVGGAHAEVMALRHAASLGLSTQGATAYVTLEPCSHHGRTGPCCEALIAAGISRVVGICADPNPLVSGQGFARMRAAGIEVEILPINHPLVAQAYELNIGFFTRMSHKRPWVRAKVAASLDGRTALNNGASQWITSAAARLDGHAWRARACAILTGIGTVLSDNPRLDVRGVETSRQPHVVVVDSRLETPLDAKLFDTARRVHIYATVQNEARKSALEARGATVTYCPEQDLQTTNRVDLSAMLLDLAKREVNELHVEAGHTLNGALLREGLIDEWLVYLAPKLIGEGWGMAQWGPLSDLSGAPALHFHSVDRVGTDLRIMARLVDRTGRP